jgi:two-component system, cell cycle response regulator CpdR
MSSDEARGKVARAPHKIALKDVTVPQLRKCKTPLKFAGQKGRAPGARQLNSGHSMKRILLAEDDNDMRQFLTRALKNAGYEVVSFDNGRSAYERLREEPFSLLLSDIVMPEMDGIELARRATELDPDLKVMFITGFAAVALNPESDTPRNASVLSKPFHLKDLVTEVERLLAA